MKIAADAESCPRFVPPSHTMRVKVLASEFALFRLKTLTDVSRVFLVGFNNRWPDATATHTLLGFESTVSDVHRATALTEHVFKLFQTEFPDVQFGGVLWLNSLPDTPEARKAEFYAAAALIYDDADPGGEKTRSET
jgi:hypothetical protein